MEFPWYGGRLSVNFTATLGKRGGAAFERILTPADLARWFHESGLAAEPPQVTPRHLTQARELRESLYAAFTDPAADLTLLNHWSARPIPGPQLQRRTNALALLPPDTDAPGLLTTLARDAATLLTSPLAPRIRECAHPDCWLLFVDESRAGTRRWCSMETCGARTKMTRYRT